MDVITKQERIWKLNVPKGRRCLPCKWCGKPMTGNFLVNLNRIKRKKYVWCPHNRCGRLNVLSAYDHVRVTTTGWWLLSGSKQDQDIAEEAAEPVSATGSNL